MSTQGREEIERALHNPAAAEAFAEALDRFQSLGLTKVRYAANLGDRRALFHIAYALQRRSILEIGTCNGASTAFLAQAAAMTAARSGDDDWRVVSVDLVDVNDPQEGFWRDSGLPFAPAEILERLGLRRGVEFLDGGSDRYLQTTEQQFDFVFIDGSHNAANVYPDVTGVLERLTPGGVVLLHDYCPGGRPIWSGEPAIPGVYLGVRRAMRDIPE
ncbi:MAG: class I SAM-dependent methyltransferase, partial [Pseudomonadota bacterium]